MRKPLKSMGPRRPAVPFALIRRDEELKSLFERLSASRCSRLAIDVEAENNLHQYGIIVSLIQLFDGKRAYVIDVLALKNPALLAPLLVRAPWKLVWFSASSDLLSIRHDLGLKPSPVLDLDIAARLLGKSGGLHDLTPRRESASAKTRLQRANWLRRPLPTVMLDYAIADVTDLLNLADSLLPELEKKGLLSEFEARNLAMQEAERSWDPFSNYTRIPGFKKLTRSGKQLAKLLWYARELYGKKTSLPSANAASKEDLRRLVDRDLRTGEAIADFLNEQRKKNYIDPGLFQSCLREAERMMETPR